MNAKPPADPAIEQDRKEWLEAIENIREQYGPDGVGSILASLREWSERNCSAGSPPPAFNTPYLNTIPVAQQPDYPGDREIEQRLENILRWNAMAMVLQGGDAGLGLGGHIATYASAATQMEVGFNHFFRQKTEDYGGDLVILQPHAATGVYVRSWLEGVLDDEHMRNYRRELAAGGGLTAYPHPRSMPDYWQVANASMGLSTPTAIYQARFAKYLENRGLKPKLGGKVWCFIGDGETDEPEVLGTINIAAREGLDNLILVVNCNLQRLDGPVRGNGKIIQELEASFLGSGWEVIKVIWGGGWDRLLARDANGALRRRMEECLDGDYQRYSVLPGDRQRELWVAGNPELEAMMDALTDEQVREIKRGGQDAVKLHAAYDRAIRSGKPAVILVKTVKGDGVAGAAGSNAAHQKKNISPEQRVEIARSLGIPLSDDEARRAAYYRPPDTSPEVRYLKERRQALGGVLPARNSDCASLEAPPLAIFKSLLAMAMKAIHKMSIEAEKDNAQLEGRSPRPDKELKPICLHKPEWGKETNRLHYHDFWVLKTLPNEMKSDPNGLILDPNEWSSKNGWTWNHDKLWKYGLFLIQPVRTGPFDIWASLGFRPVADLIKGPKTLDLEEGATVIAKYLGKESGKAKGNPTINALNAKGNPLIKQHTTANYGRKKIRNAMRELTDDELLYACDLPNAQILQIWQNLAFNVPTKQDILVEAGKEHRRRFGNLANAIFAENQTRMKFPEHIRAIRKKQRDLQHEKQLRADITTTGPMIEQIISKLLKHTCPEMGELQPGIKRDLLCTHARTAAALFKCKWAIKNSQHAWGQAGYSKQYQYDDSAAEFGQEILNALECTLAYCDAAYTGLHMPDEQIKRPWPECQTDDYELAIQFETVTATLSRPDKTDAERGDALDRFTDFIESEIELQSV